MRSGHRAGTSRKDGMGALRGGERDVDELMAAAMEAIEGDVTNCDTCMDLTQTIQDVFDHAVFQ